jgi:hypothetical protein
MRNNSDAFAPNVVRASNAWHGLATLDDGVAATRMNVDAMHKTYGVDAWALTVSEDMKNDFHAAAEIG